MLSSDDEDIIEVAKHYACEVPFKRDAHLSSDTATSDDVILDALSRIDGFDTLLLLQPTSPLRISEDIEKCLELYLKAPKTVRWLLVFARMIRAVLIFGAYI